MSSSVSFLYDFIQQHPNLFVLTGAGCSTASGIPDYRDDTGAWKRRQPMTFQTFAGSRAARQRYWARSMMGWPLFTRARPNGAHQALAVLEAHGFVRGLVTQNVDGLHQQAGSRAVIDLHGRLDQVVCLACGKVRSRADFQQELTELNPAWAARPAQQAPDGDADVDGVAFDTFQVPGCRHCGGVMKPDVVFFGENVPRERVQAALGLLDAADAVLVVGSSLAVFSGFRFVRAAVERGLPTVAINLGRTRADALLTCRIAEPCADVLTELARIIDHRSS